MLIRDLLESGDGNRAKLPVSTRKSLPRHFCVPEMDQYYEYYRFLVSVAGLPEADKIPTRGPIHDSPWVAPYSQVEYDQSVEIIKKMGKTIKHLTAPDSQECDFVNVSSPVRKFKDVDGLT